MTDDKFPDLAQHPEKNSDARTTGGGSIIGPQASHLVTLLQRAGHPESDLDPALTQADASKLIDELQKETGRGA